MKRAFCGLAAAAMLAACSGSKDPVLARVGGLTITQSEFQRKLADVAQGYQDYVLTPDGRRQFLDVLIREKLLLAAAEQSDVPRSAAYRERVERLRRDEEERVREGREALLVAAWLDELRARGVLKVSDDEVRGYLRAHPTEIELRHILLATPEKAAEAARRLRRGADFAKLAKAESLDAATAERGGRFPPLLYGEILPELEDVAAHLRPGEIGGPIKSKFGYHVLRKDGERRLADTPATRERVARLLEKQKLDAYLKAIQDKYPVEVVHERFQ